MRYRSIAAVLALAASAAGGDRVSVHPLDAPQPADYPQELHVFIEIPTGGGTKYETDKHTGIVFVDRFLAAPVRYPANYGSLPQTLMPDGDPLDALVLTREPLRPGVMIRVRPIGVMRMLDGGTADDKLVTVPAHALDPSFDGVSSVLDLPPLQREAIAAFFRAYKTLPKGYGVVEIPGFEGPGAAGPLAEGAHRAYVEARD